MNVDRVDILEHEASVHATIVQAGGILQISVQPNVPCVPRGSIQEKDSSVVKRVPMTHIQISSQATGVNIANLESLQETM